MQENLYKIFQTKIDLNLSRAAVPPKVTMFKRKTSLSQEELVLPHLNKGGLIVCQSHFMRHVVLK